MTEHTLDVDETMSVGDPTTNAPAPSNVTEVADSGDEPPFIGDLQYAIVGRQTLDLDGNPVGPEETFNPPQLAAELKAGERGYLIDPNAAQA